jgi:hypothetical protein
LLLAVGGFLYFFRLPCLASGRIDISRLHPPILGQRQHPASLKWSSNLNRSAPLEPAPRATTNKPPLIPVQHQYCSSSFRQLPYRCTAPLPAPVCQAGLPRRLRPAKQHRRQQHQGRASQPIPALSTWRIPRSASARPDRCQPADVSVLPVKCSTECPEELQFQLISVWHACFIPLWPTPVCVRWRVPRRPAPRARPIALQFPAWPLCIQPVQRLLFLLTRPRTQATTTRIWFRSASYTIFIQLPTCLLASNVHMWVAKSTKQLACFPISWSASMCQSPGLPFVASHRSLACLTSSSTSRRSLPRILQWYWLLRLLPLSSGDHSPTGTVSSRYKTLYF